MTPWQLAWRGVWHHRRTWGAVGLGVALTVAVLVAAAAVGDTVAHSLERRAAVRLGRITHAVAPVGRLVRAALADDLADELGGDAVAAPVLVVPAVASVPTAEGARTVRDVRVMGVDARFFAAYGAAAAPELGGAGLANPALWGALGVAADTEIVLRLADARALPADAAFAPDGTEVSALRVRVRAAPPAGAGEAGSLWPRFDLRLNAPEPLSLVVPLETLQAAVALEGKVNHVLVATGDAEGGAVDAALRARWTLEDAGLTWRALGEGEGTEASLGPEGVAELASARVLLEPAVGEAVEVAASAGGGGVRPTRALTWLANRLESKAGAVPYSFVAALDPFEEVLGVSAPGEGELVVNRWLADALSVGPGDEVVLRWFTLDSRRALEEASRAFRVASVVEVEGAAADPSWMPEFPGFVGAAHCRDWRPGLPVDTSQIRDADEAYWEAHRGTPKAFLPLEVGQAMWGSRWGALTAVRVPAAGREAFGARVRAALDPTAVDLEVRDLAAMVGASATPANSFTGLFVGFGFVLIVAALVLTALMLRLSVAQRRRELMTLAAVGFTRRAVSRVLMREGAVVAGAAAVLGALGGLGLTRGVLAALAAPWSEAVGGLPLELHATRGAVVASAAAGWLVAVGAMAWALRAMDWERVAPARGGDGSGATRWLTAGRVAGVAGLGAAGALAAAVGLPDTGLARIGAFFGAGGLMMVALLAGARRGLGAMSARDAGLGSLGRLAVRNAARQAGRSFAVLVMLALGAFLVVGVGSHRHDPLRDAERRGSGTGGFALWGESTLPVTQVLDPGSEGGAAGLEAFGLAVEDLKGARIVPLRVRGGDDASCLQPGQAQVPRVWGIDPGALAERGAFSFGALDARADAGAPWRVLDLDVGEGVVPVVGDEGTVVWGLNLGLGDRLEVPVEAVAPGVSGEGEGGTVTLKIVGVTGTNVLQGGLVMSEARFDGLWPSEPGYRAFLVDAAPAVAERVAATLEDALGDKGLGFRPAWRQLMRFRSVENTFLTVFLALGALGLALGALGVGVLLLRNVLERRRELVVLSALGFRRRRLGGLVWLEHAGLLLVGLLAGAGPALVAQVPAFASPGVPFPWAAMGLALAGAVGAGLVSVGVATLVAFRGEIAPAREGG